jgi:hypothetical protein
MRRLPGDLPAWLTMGRLFGVAHGLGLIASVSGWAALVSLGARPMVSSFELEAWTGVLVGAGGAMGSTLGASILVARARTVVHALLASVLGAAGAFAAIVFGRILHDAMNSFSEMFVEGQVVRVVSWDRTIESAIFLGVISVVIGAIVGAVLARPTIWAIRSRGTRAASSGRALFGIGAWLMVPAAIAGFGASMASVRTIDANSPMVLGTLGTALLAAGGAIAGALLLYRRSHWIEKVRRGEVKGFRIRVAGNDHHTLPRLDNTAPDEQSVLEEVIETDEDPYRSAQLAQPIARVD